MIDLSPSSPMLAQAADHVKIKVLGLGGAGSNALDRLLIDGLDFAEGIAINTDVQALQSSVATAKVQIGRQTTRGLGAGGDPEVGLAAAEEALDELHRVVADAELVFLCTGLGGGTGSGAASLIAAQAREQGAMVVGFVTMPFGFEGRRRRVQAEEALAALSEAADVVICFENDRMGETVSPQAGIHQAFAASDLTLSQSLRAVCELFKRPGLMSIGFGDLARVLGGQHTCCLFGHGESETDNRAHEALARALKSPLMERGRLLHEATAVLVNIAGGPSMTLNEVQILMEEFNKYIGSQTQVFFGTAVDPRLGNKLVVTLISSLGGEVPVAVAPARSEPARRAVRLETSPSIALIDPPTHPSHGQPVIALQAKTEPVEEIVVAIIPASAPLAELTAYEAESVVLAPEPAAADSVFYPDPVDEPVLEVTAEPEREEPEPVAGNEGAAATPVPPHPPEPAWTAAAEPEPAPQPELEPVAEREAEPMREIAKPEPAPRTPRAIPPRPARTFAPEPMLPMEMPTAKEVAPKVPQQETLPFETVSRGRFEKSEPTIVDGQDLDVPTFMRRNLRVK